MKSRLKSFQLTREAGFGFLSQKLSIVFMGTPEFACLPFEKIAERENVVAVVTQPDKPRGRGKKIQPSPVKKVAQQKGIPVYQPENLEDSEFLEQIASLQPHLIVVVAFGRLLPRTVLDIPQIYPINLHPSLLPEYRGPAPIPWVLIKGEKKTGVTVQKMEEEMDAGEIILQKTLLIAKEDDAGTLARKLSYLGAEALLEAIHLIKRGKVRLRPQKGKGSYTPKITKEMGKIDWTSSAEEIHNLIRGLSPYPGAFTFFNRKGKNQTIKILEAATYKDSPDKMDAPPGTVVKMFKDRGFAVKTGKGLLLVKKVQLPGKSKISAYDFVQGYHIKKGSLLGG